MSLKMLIEKLEDVPETLREMYAKTDDGKFRLSVEGVEDPAQLKKALKAEREARAEFEKKLKSFDGIDPEAARKLLNELGEDEDLKLWQSGKKDVVQARWVEKMRAAFDAKIKAAEEQLAAEVAKTNKYVSRVLDDGIRAAAAKVGIHQHAVEDALYRARSIFTLDDSGDAVQLRDGAVVMGKDGKTPYSPVEWLESMRETAPHWYPASGAGSGSQQSSRQSSGNGQHTMKRAAFDQLSAKEKMAKSKEGITLID